MADLICGYRLAQCLSMATLTSVAARASDTFQEKALSNAKKASIIVGLCGLTLVSNILGVTVSIRLNITPPKSLRQLILDLRQHRACCEVVEIISNHRALRSNDRSKPWQ
jgi:hypothetical protein